MSRLECTIDGYNVILIVSQPHHDTSCAFIQGGLVMFHISRPRYRDAALFKRPMISIREKFSLEQRTRRWSGNRKLLREAKNRLCSNFIEITGAEPYCANFSIHITDSVCLDDLSVSAD